MIRSNEIYNELKKSVFGQDEYLKALAVLGYKHELKNKQIEDGKTPINTNLLVIGPSGCGKTFSVKMLSSIIDVPFYEIDCSNIVQTGYKGSMDVEAAFRRLFTSLGVDAKHAIVYLDEFDKVFDLSLYVDGKGKTSQQNYLKFLEQGAIGSGSNKKSCFNYDTSGITFVATGSFEIVKEGRKRTNASKMGFNALNGKGNDIKLDADDLIKFGYMPELIGRFSKIININQLKEDDFYNIVKNGVNSSVRSYESAIKDQGIELIIDDDVYSAIARKAYNSVTGARNISNVLNDVLDDVLADISNDDTICSVHIRTFNGEFTKAYKHDQSRINNYFFKEIEDEIMVPREDVLKNIKSLSKEKGYKIKIMQRATRYIDDLYYENDSKDIKRGTLSRLIRDLKNEIARSIFSTLSENGQFTSETEDCKDLLCLMDYLEKTYVSEEQNEKEVQ